MSHLQLPIIVTPTRVEAAARCHRRHVLGDILDKALYPSPSLEFGTLIHSGVSNYWLDRDWNNVIKDEWLNRFERTNVSQEKVSLAMATAMMEYYVGNAKLAGPFDSAADDWQLVDVEQRFRVKLGEDSYKSFQMDRILYSKSQNWLVIGDSKTAARLDARWEKQWEKSLQMKLYKAGARNVFQHEGRIDVFIEGILKDVPSKLRYYACPEWSDAMLQEALWRAQRVAEDDAELVKACVDPRDGTMNRGVAEDLAVRYTTFNYGDCFSYGVECPFHRICTADPDERVGILRGEYFEKVEEDY